MKREESYMQQLVKYIKNNVSKGYTIEALKWALINQGHSKSEVSKAMELANQELAKQAPVLKEKPIIKIEGFINYYQISHEFSSLKRQDL